MSIISSTISVSRYHIEGKFEESVMDSVKMGLIQQVIPKTESEFDQIIAGWTSYEKPYTPDFERTPFIYGTYFVFSLRIDKKNIPQKLIKKHMAVEMANRIEKSGREFLSRQEKSEIKDQVTDHLIRQIPSVPHIYDVLWDYESSNLCLFTTHKTANEFFETLFLKSFGLKPIRLFPYTMIELKSKFSNHEKDQILNLSLIKYSR